MARETKVGLLAGLAFIICFAVILANRGANTSPGSANAFLPNGGLELPKLMQQKKSTTADSTVHPNKVVRKPAAIPTQPNSLARDPAGQPNPQLATSETIPGTGAQLPLDGRPQPPTPSADSALALNTRPVDQPIHPNAGLERALTSPSTTPSLQRTDAPASMTATAPTTGQQNPFPVRVAQNEPPPSQPATPPVIQGTPYTVKPSDTLSSIAAAHYGAKSKKMVEAIFEANRGVLPNMDTLKVGMMLTIPQFASANPQAMEKPQPDVKVALASEKVADPKNKDAQKAPSKKDATDKKPAKKVEQVAETGKGSSPFKWYQVKKNDRFASIAREQLGDAGRWHEIYELNKDKFSDPNHIRDGVRIKLPVPDSLASAARQKEKTR